MSEFPPKEVQLLVTEISGILRLRNQTLGVSEAACGGLISAYLVSVPGASNFYIGGKLVYSLKQRLKLSGWSDSDISHYMGPSEEVALRLARTTKYELGSTFVLSETGYAGPGTDLHLNDSIKVKENNSSEVGTVFLGLHGPNLEVSTTKRTTSQVRALNMAQFAKFALEFLLEQLKAQ